MKDFIENTMSLIIIGDENNHSFDGKFKLNGKKEGFHFHRDSLKHIIKEFLEDGYQLENINSSLVNEAGFNLINLGHILFCNCTVEKHYCGYLFLPKILTKGQLDSLKLFEQQFQLFETLYIMTINVNNKEYFDTKLNSYNFNIDELTGQKLYSKTK